jgi:hypothetical protein
MNCAVSVLCSKVKSCEVLVKQSVVMPGNAEAKQSVAMVQLSPVVSGQVLVRWDGAM